MIGHIKGIVEFINIDSVVVDVQGVGYMVYMPASAVYKLQIGSTVKVFTYLHVREDIMQLYGFLDNMELEIFKMLLGVNGVGPKAALSILSQCNCDEIVAGINSEIPDVFTRVSGIGKKTAQRIVLDLKDKTKNLTITIKGQPIDNIVPVKEISVIEETISALVSLGYNPREVKDIAYDTAKENQDTSTVEELLGKVLKKLGPAGR